MAKAWKEHSTDEKNAVFEALAKIYEENGHPAGLKPPSQTSEYVNILMAKQKQDAVRPLAISGEFGPDQKEFADKLSTALKGALANVSDA